MPKLLKHVNHFNLLFIFTLVAILISPVCYLPIPVIDDIFRILFVLLLGIILYEFQITRQEYNFYFGLLIPLLLVCLLNFYFNTGWLYVLQFVLFIAFGFYGVYSIISTIFSRKLFRNNAIFWGAGCGYLVLGITWGAFYHILNALIPYSFINIHHWTDFIYYSFTTLTTLGYGDIVPIHPIAKMFSITEAIVGVLYTTLLVAKLINLYSYHFQKHTDRK